MPRGYPHRTRFRLSGFGAVEREVGVMQQTLDFGQAGRGRNTDG